MKRIIYTLLTAVVIIAAGCKGKEIQVDRSIVPVAGPAPKIQIGQYQLFELENGLKVIVVENHKLPRVSYSINLDTDPILEGEKAGYVSMAGDLMSAGTTTKSKAQKFKTNNKMLLKTATTTISPMHITQVNSTKNKLSRPIGLSKKGYRTNSEKSKQTTINNDSMRTKARKFIQNDLSAESRRDSKGNKRKLMIYTKKYEVEKGVEVEESEQSF